MTNIEAVKAVLLNRGCQTAESIALDAARLYQANPSPNEVRSICRSLIRQGIVGTSRDDAGRARYWLADNVFSLKEGVTYDSSLFVPDTLS